MGSRARMMKLWRDLRASYWFVPVVLVALSQAAAGGLLWLDSTQPDLVAALLPRALGSTQAEGARSLLSLMASAVIGVAGVMFSLTMVAVSFASGNFGPRLVGNFMRDRGNQWSLGAMIATFTFCLQVLRAVKSPVEGAQFVPHLALTAAVALTLISVLVMIYFIHHVPETIDVGNITAALGWRLERAVRAEIARREEVRESTLEPDGPPIASVPLDRSGYVQTMDYARLAALGERHGWHLRVLAQPGDFVAAGAAVTAVSAGQGAEERPAGPDAAATAALAACFALGDSRTEDQAPLFLVDQLVEILARALSPGVNDPFTACDCLNRMYAALHAALACGPGLGQPQERALEPCLTFDALLERSFASSVPYVAGDPIARHHMAGLIGSLRALARSAGEAAAIEALVLPLQRAAD